MLQFRLIYEQIETARAHLLAGSLLDLRLALILLDNAAELLMHRELQTWLHFYDQMQPKWEPAYSDWLRAGLGPKYTPEERQEAQREFEPKTKILCLRLGKISSDDRAILTVCHRLRCEAFHAGRLREAILKPVVAVLLATVVGLTHKLSLPPLVLHGARPAGDDALFLERFGVDSPYTLVTENGKKRLAAYLLAEVAVDLPGLAEALSSDVVERIDDTVGNLSYLGESGDGASIDRTLQYTQFWRDAGIELAKSGVREPALEAAFLKWQSDGKATFTLRGLHRWRRQAVAIARAAVPARALDHYWAIDKRLRPLEDDVGQAVFRYDEEINSRI